MTGGCFMYPELTNAGEREREREGKKEGVLLKCVRALQFVCEGRRVCVDLYGLYGVLCVGAFWVRR